MAAEYSGLLEKHSLAIAGHRTSITLERVFWQALLAIAKKRGVSRMALIAEIDRQRARLTPPPNLSSAIRTFVAETLLEKFDA